MIHIRQENEFRPWIRLLDKFRILRSHLQVTLTLDDEYRLRQSRHQTTRIVGEGADQEFLHCGIEQALQCRVHVPGIDTMALFERINCLQGPRQDEAIGRIGFELVAQDFTQWATGGRHQYQTTDTWLIIC